MSNRKNYNSIVFLTTLSVYLGLVLVGGTAPVLAHSALTRDFDIKNEIEFKDDLDNKPDNEEIESFFEIDLDTAVASFIEDLRGLKQKGKYKSNFKKTFITGCAHSYCSIEEAAASTADEYQDSEIWRKLSKLHEKLDVANRRSLGEISFIGFPGKEKGCKEISLHLTFSQKELEIAFSFTKETAQTAFAYAENLNSKFKNKSDESSDLLIKKVYENTKAATENNQVFVVTRLPRASIDEFLTNKVAN
jgi:hypothetical protein